MILTHRFRAWFGALLFTTLPWLTGMPAAQASSNPQTLTFGVAPGPYGDMVNQILKPQLEKKGYKVAVREFSDYVQPNLALANGSIDANLFQHSLYLEKFSADKGLKLSKLITVPTASMGFYSKKIHSLDELKKGDVITLSNDATNLARGLRFLQSLGLITIKPDIDATKASEKDIVDNPRGLVFKPLEAAQLPRTLDSVTASLVNGNFAFAAGLKLSTAIKLETLDENLKNVIAVRTDDLNKPFVQDIKAAVESDDYATAINAPGSMFSEFQKPEWMTARAPHNAQ